MASRLAIVAVLTLVFTIVETVTIIAWFLLEEIGKDNHDVNTVIMSRIILFGGILAEHAIAQSISFLLLVPPVEGQPRMIDQINRATGG